MTGCSGIRSPIAWENSRAAQSRAEHYLHVSSLSGQHFFYLVFVQLLFCISTMCLGPRCQPGSDASGLPIGGVPNGDRLCTASITHSIPAISGFYANVRSLRQAVGDIRKQIPAARADVFFLTETHLDDDPMKHYIPSGYRVISRYDRTAHGGGVIAGCKKHLLATPLDLREYV